MQLATQFLQFRCIAVCDGLMAIVVRSVAEPVSHPARLAEVAAFAILAASSPGSECRSAVWDGPSAWAPSAHMSGTIKLVALHVLKAPEWQPLCRGD